MCLVKVNREKKRSKKKVFVQRKVKPDKHLFIEQRAKYKAWTFSIVYLLFKLHQRFIFSGKLGEFHFQSFIRLLEL